MFLKRKVSNAIGKEILISDELSDAIMLWGKCYRDKAPWTSEDIKSLNLCSAISSEFARQVTLELSSEVTGGERAAVIDECYQKMLSAIRSIVEYACALGGVVFKPYVDDGVLEVEYIGADNFFPTKFNGRGEVVSAAFCESKKVGEKRFIRVEHHELTKSGVEITNRAFSVGSIFETMSEVALDNVEEWKNISK